YQFGPTCDPTRYRAPTSLPYPALALGRGLFHTFHTVGRQAAACNRSTKHFLRKRNPSTPVSTYPDWIFSHTGSPFPEVPAGICAPLPTACRTLFFSHQVATVPRFDRHPADTICYVFPQFSQSALRAGCSRRMTKCVSRQSISSLA